MLPAAPVPDEPVTPVAASRGARWRDSLAVFLIVLGCLLAALALLAVWLNRRVADTDAYVQTVAPLADEPAIRHAVSVRLTDRLFTEFDIAEAMRRALPDQADILAAPATASLKDFTQKETEKLFASPRFRELWEQANRRAHEKLLALALGESRYGISVTEGRVTLDLAVIGAWQSEHLDRFGFDFSTPDSDEAGDGEELVIIESEGLGRLQAIIAWLNRLANWLPALSLLALTAAFITARDRSRAGIRIGAGLSLAAAAMLILMAAGRHYYLDSLTTADPVAAQRFFEVIFQSLRSAARGMFAAGLLLTALAWLASPRMPLSRLWRAAADLASDHLPLAAGDLVRTHQKGLRISGLLAVMTLLVWRDDPSLTLVLILAALYGFFLAVIELLKKMPDKPA